MVARPRRRRRGYPPGFVANPLQDIQRALSSLAILPDIGRHIAGMRRDVKRMADAVENLPREVAFLREDVKPCTRT